MKTLGKPLAVCRVVTYCDSKHEHEVEVISSGSQVYANSTSLPTPQAEYAFGVGTKIRVPCPVPVRGQGACTGEAVLDLAEDEWTANPEYVDAVVDSGKPVE